MPKFMEEPIKVSFIWIRAKDKLTLGVGGRGGSELDTGQLLTHN